MKTTVLNKEAMIEWLEGRLEGFVRDEDYRISVSGEDRDEYKGRRIYDYYCEDFNNYTFGVLNEWEAELKKRGWRSEWNDCGTVHLLPLH